MPRKVRVALSGLGSVSQRGVLPHLAQPDALERVELVACCDVVAERAEQTARKFGWQQWYTDYDEMIAKADVEAVLLAGPIPVHYPQAMTALRANKHVYVQKSMTVTLAEANDVVNEANSRGLKLVASPGQMLNPIFQTIKQNIADGVIGKVYWAFSSTVGGGHENESLRAGTGALAAIDPTWYYKQGGGPIYDMTVYVLHALTGILGPVKQVTAMSGIGLKERRWKDVVIPVEMDDNTLILLDFGNDVFAVATGQNCKGAPAIGFGRMIFFGSGGTIDTGRPMAGLEITSDTGLPGMFGFTGGSYNVGAQRTLKYVVGPHVTIPESHVYNDIMHTVECIVENTTPVPTGEHARHVVELIEKAYLSAETGQHQALTTTF